MKLQIKQSELAQEVEDMERVTQMPGVNFSPGQDIVHHPQCPNCESDKYI